MDLLVSDIKCLKKIQFSLMHRVANKLNIYKLKYMQFFFFFWHHLVLSNYRLFINQDVLYKHVDGGKIGENTFTSKILTYLDISLAWYMKAYEYLHS